MSNQIEELLNNTTLASPEKLKEVYLPKNLSQKDANLLAQISKSSLVSIEQSIGSLTHLIQNLKIYKECLIDAINLQAESADIATKYAVNPPQQSHQLPGVISTPETYDLEGIKQDNARMMQIKDEKDKALQQKEIYLRISEEDVRLFLAGWKRLNYQDASFSEFVESLNKQINPMY